jgi:hypothetical protein
MRYALLRDENQLVHVALDDYQLALLLEASEALNLTVDALICEAVAEFLDERKNRWSSDL